MSQLRKAAVEKAGKLIAQILASENMIAALKNEIANLDPKEAAYPIDRDELAGKRDAEMKRCYGLKMALETLERTEFNESLIRVISQTSKRAEIIIQGKEENGTKTSLTRHLRRENGKWVGWSLFGHKTREFILEVGSQFAEAAA